MKNLLVTGGCGFIGSNFIHYLFEQTDFAGRVINLDALTYAGNLENIADLAQRKRGRHVFECVDITEMDAVWAIFDEYEIDSVCHLAAESHVDRSIASPGDFVSTNLVGTYNLLECARARGENFDLFCHVSTDEVFGSIEEGQSNEAAPYRPNSPYAASKAGADHLVRSYWKTYGLPVKVSNCSNNYGPYQFPEKLVPLTILKLLAGEETPVYGDGKHRRDWIYVEDHCEALYRILTMGETGKSYNIGTGSDVENLEVVGLLAGIIDQRMGLLDGGYPRQELITFVEDRPGHDRRYAIDSTYARESLGWEPRYTLEEGMRKTVDWYLKHPTWVEHIKSGRHQDWIRHHYARG